MPYADPEQIVKRWLIVNLFPGAGEDRVRVVVGDPDSGNLNVQHSQRLVRVTQIPGPGDGRPTMDVADVEINCYARNPERVKPLANQVRVAMQYQLEKATDPDTGAFVKQVRWLAVPALTPSDTSMFSRHMGTARLWIHHDPTA